MTGSDLAVHVYQLGVAVAYLVIASAGLAVIFGMMGVVNMAHGELIMIGAYATSASYHAGLALPLAMLSGVLVTTAVGFVMERLLVRRLYGRSAESLVVTWALGLVISQATLILFGPSMAGISPPLGNVGIGKVAVSQYSLLLIGIGIFLPFIISMIFNRTKFGLHARAVMLSPDIARAIGIDERRIYAQTFAIGSALAGLCGALYAPTISIVPTMGGGFVVQAFVTVVTGGGSILFGTLPAAVGLGAIQSVLTSLFGNLLGVLGLLGAVIISARFFPNGIAALILKERRA